MRAWLLLVVCTIWLAASGPEARAQRPGEAPVIPTLTTSEAPEAEGGTQWLSGYGGWTAFGPYVVADRDHAWYHELGGVLELVRGREWGLLATARSTLMADPDNSIRFNPRAVFWDEGLLFVRQFEGVDLHLGYVHRCKHDVDNLALGEERALIFGSVLGRAVVPLSSRPSDSYLAVDANVYTARQDDRRPASSEELPPNWERLRGSMGSHLHLQRSLTSTVGTYLNAGGSVVAYGDDEDAGRFEGWAPVRFNGRVSAGLSLRGVVELRTGVEYAYLSDTGIPARPRDAHLVRLSVQVSSPSMIR